MEIDITNFVNNKDPYEFSASRAERGQNAGCETWNNAKVEGKAHPLLRTKEQVTALRTYVKDFGAWTDDEIDHWTKIECNAMFIQLVSGDMREAGMDIVDMENFDWPEYERRAEKGEISSNLYRGDNGRIYYYLGS